MNIVTKVKYANFLAAGNVPIEVDLTKHATTLVIGKNGAGKSTLHEAICFAWFGRPLRKINKPALVNWINSRDCLVELEWHLSNGTAYKVRRGIKPNIFEIFKNGVLEPVPADIDDYQSHLEAIIKLNHKSFMQVVVLGGSSYVPFMRLPVAGRRGIIEDLLDIEVFSVMNALAKEDLIELKGKTETNQTTCRLLDQQVKMARSFEQQLVDDTKQRIAVIDASVVTTNGLIEGLLADRVGLVDNLSTYAPYEEAKTAATAKMAEFEQTLYKLQARTDKEAEKALYEAQGLTDTEGEKLLSELQGQKAKNAKERAFYKKHDECPTCEQSITEAFKSQRFETMDATDASLKAAIGKCEARLEEFAQTKVATIATCQERIAASAKAKADAIVQCKALIAKYRKAQEEAAKQLESAVDIKTDINAIDVRLPLHRRRLKELEQERQAALAPKPVAPDVDVDALVGQLQDLQTEQAALSAERVVLDAASMLLKDSGIKTRLIRHYLPIINKFIQSYLTAMDFAIVFTFDEEFEEHIKTHYGDSFSYEQFSDGEKKRIDLALLLTWRAVARLKNSASTNLLVLDEVFDSSLDLAGMEEFLKIIHGLESDANVFVMSHRVDQMIDKFAHVLMYEKVRGFSQVKT